MIVEKYYDLPKGSLEYLINAKNDFFKYGFNKNDDLTLRQEYQDFMRKHSKLYRSSEGLTPTVAAQKFASKFLSQFTDSIFTWLLLPQYYIYFVAISCLISAIKYYVKKKFI